MADRSSAIRHHPFLISPIGSSRSSWPGRPPRSGVSVVVGGEPLDDGHVGPAALDGEGAPVREGRRIASGSSSAGPGTVAELGGLEPGVAAGELAGVVLGVPGREPDEAEAVVRALEDGEAVAVPAGGGGSCRRGGGAGRRAASRRRRSGRPPSSRRRRSSVPRSTAVGGSGLARYFSGWRICSVESGGLAIGLVERLPAAVVGQVGAEDQAAEVGEDQRLGEDRRAPRAGSAPPAIGMNGHQQAEDPVEVGRRGSARSSSRPSRPSGRRSSSGSPRPRSGPRGPGRGRRRA